MVIQTVNKQTEQMRTIASEDIVQFSYCNQFRGGKLTGTLHVGVRWPWQSKALESRQPCRGFVNLSRAFAFDRWGLMKGAAVSVFSCISPSRSESMSTAGVRSVYKLN